MTLVLPQRLIMQGIDNISLHACPNLLCVLSNDELSLDVKRFTLLVRLEPTI